MSRNRARTSVNCCSPQRLRYLTFEELVIRYNLDFSFDTELPVTQQLLRLAEIDDWVHRYGNRFQPGGWYFAEKPLG